MWELLLDGKTLRMRFPPMPIAGLRGPLNLFFDLDTATVDRIIEQLTILRSRMVPKPQATKGKTQH